MMHPAVYPTLIDEYLPEYGFSARRAIVVRARVDEVYCALHQTDFGRSHIIRALLTMRAVPAAVAVGRWPRAGESSLKLSSFERAGFTILDENPPHELLFGLIGRFWSPAGGLCVTSTEEFRPANQPGTAKAAWNFRLTCVGDHTRLSTETRVHCVDRAAYVRFRAYWTVVRPFSGLLRRSMLREIRRQAERTAAAPLR